MIEPDAIDYRALQFWLNVGQWVGYLILGIYVWLSNRQKATVAQIEAVSRKVDALDKVRDQGCVRHLNRTVTMEALLTKAPTHADIGALHDRVTAVKGGVDEVNGMLKGLRDNVNLLVDHHLRGGNK